MKRLMTWVDVKRRAWVNVLVGALAGVSSPETNHTISNALARLVRRRRREPGDDQAVNAAAPVAARCPPTPHTSKRHGTN